MFCSPCATQGSQGPEISPSASAVTKLQMRAFVRASTSMADSVTTMKNVTTKKCKLGSNYLIGAKITGFIVIAAAVVILYRMSEEPEEPGESSIPNAVALLLLWHCSFALVTRSIWSG